MPVKFTRENIANAVVKRKARTKPRLSDPTVCQKIYEEDEFEFLMAIKRYSETTGRKFPTWSEALGVLKGLGYTKGTP